MNKNETKKTETEKEKVQKIEKVRKIKVPKKKVLKNSKCVQKFETCPNSKKCSKIQKFDERLSTSAPTDRGRVGHCSQHGRKKHVFHLCILL